MIESLLAIMTSSGFGAVTGGIFGWLNRREDRKAREKDQAFKIAHIKATSAAEVSNSEADAFKESQITKSTLGDIIKSAVRPVITGYLMYMVYLIYGQLEQLTGGISALPAAEVVDLYRAIVLNILCLASMAVSWWFASRPTAITTDLISIK